ncbi:SpoIID/LytB domain-containing protein [Paenibacillus tarimensis]
MKSIRRFSAVLVIAMTIAAIVSAIPSYGAVPKLDQIRVAIFLNLPGKYTTTVSTATFSGTDGLNIGIRNPSGIDHWFRQEASKQARFTLHDYKVLIGETTDFNGAIAILKRVQSISKDAWLTSMNKYGKTVYQITEGVYPTQDEVRLAAERWGMDTDLLRLTSQNKPVPTGPLYLEASSYPSMTEAAKAAASFGGAGLDNFIAVKKSEDGKIEYTVHVGAAAGPAELEVIRSQAEKAAVGPLTEPDNTLPYMQIRDDHTLSLKANTADSLYLIQGTGTKVSLTTSPNGTIKLNERYERSYRGQFEVSGFNNRLAVVNELPFEHYLYSVVGAEMPASWPAEALKAQAVAARSYAIHQGFGFQIAHVVDSVQSQSYGGIGAEKQATINAVNLTSGVVIMHEGKVIEALFSSSAGGTTADASEIWGNPVAYLSSIPSPDHVSEAGLYSWYRIVLPDGRTGYVREDLAEETGEKTAAGSSILRIKGDSVTVRTVPLIQSEVQPVDKLNSGTRVVLLEKVIQSNEMSWVRGPFTAQTLTSSMQPRINTPLSGPILTVEASKRGASWRVTELLVNGEPLDIRYPDTLRSALGGLPSTRFEIDETARMSIAGATGARTERPADSSTMYLLGADGKAQPLETNNIYILDGSGKVRAATKDPEFRFNGTGNGHGVGMSQWGAKGLAEKGYDYDYILKYYYNNVTVAKD